MSWRKVCSGLKRRIHEVNTPLTNVRGSNISWTLPCTLRLDLAEPYTACTMYHLRILPNSKKAYGGQWIIQLLFKCLEKGITITKSAPIPTLVLLPVECIVQLPECGLYSRGSTKYGQPVLLLPMKVNALTQSERSRRAA